jgi:hypothetical protein
MLAAKRGITSLDEKDTVTGGKEAPAVFAVAHD